MQSLRDSRAWLVCTLLAALVLATVAATANNGRQFSGYFDMSGVHEQGDLMQVTLHLKLFNHSETDAKSVIVALMDSSSPAENLRGNFQPVRVWKSQKFIEMSQEFFVTKREFADWMRGPGQPHLIILFQDSKGKTWQKGAQISHRPLVQREEQN